ncbi:Hypothetical predicted protein [Paramuricea clavata]|uniref:Uncharacterized protein n=1 Tax=Paramuricea clavata TaxID=317549 RepID=A0A7D9EEI8_PARCT|nr:Hypothetical predicted protein [Paramuricea clavata]
MNAQSGESVEGYTLENIELEYESIENNNLARKSENLYGAERELSFEHTTLMKKTEWDKNSTIVNETINVPRRSMKAVVMLFTEKTSTDSEEYIFPNIEKVKVTIEGVPNVIYSQGMTKTRMYEEAKRLFGTDTNSQQNLIKFYKDKKFALVLDLRTANDPKTYGNGVKIQNTQSESSNSENTNRQRIAMRRLEEAVREETGDIIPGSLVHLIHNNSQRNDSESRRSIYKSLFDFLSRKRGVGNGASLVYPQELLDVIRAYYPDGIRNYPPRAGGKRKILYEVSLEELIREYMTLQRPPSPEY